MKTVVNIETWLGKSKRWAWSDKECEFNRGGDELNRQKMRPKKVNLSSMGDHCAFSTDKWTTFFVLIWVFLISDKRIV